MGGHWTLHSPSVGRWKTVVHQPDDGYNHVSHFLICVSDRRYGVIHYQYPTAQTQGSLKSYACLSHVWGAKEKYRCGGGLQNIPQTIKDAMSVCSALGVQYLWVDRYCIDQNNTEEGHHLIFNMDKIYQRGHPAIIASARPDPHDGLPGVWTLRGDLSSTYEPAEKCLYRLRTSEGKSRYLIQRSWMDVSGDCPLSATSGFH
jgi:hypothetical protein